MCSLIQQKKKKNHRSIGSRIILLISLSLSDIATCFFITLRIYVHYAMDINNVGITVPSTYKCVNAFLKVIIPTCNILSLLNLLGMAIDHWITFTKPFRYFVVSIFICILCIIRLTEILLRTLNCVVLKAEFFKCGVWTSRSQQGHRLRVYVDIPSLYTYYFLLQ